MHIERIEKPTFNFATPKRVRDHSRVPTGQDDDIFQLATRSADDYIERYLECTIGLSAWRLTLDSFPLRGPLLIPRWPVRNVTEIAYYDVSGQASTVPAEQIVQPVGEERFLLRLRNPWPTTDNSPNGITIDFTAGWETQDDIPATLVRAGLMLTAHWYENPEAVITGTISKEVEFGVKSMLEMLQVEDDE